MISAESHYLELAAAYCRGRLRAGLPGDGEAVAVGEASGLRLHRFKRTSGLPRVRRILGALHALAPRTLLDLGTGRGVFLWPLLDEIPEVHVVATDRLAHRVEELAAVGRGGLDRLAAARMDATRLAVRDGAVDVVTALEVLEHIPDAAAAIREAVRASRRAVLVTVPSHEDDNPEHIHLFDGARLEALFRAAAPHSARVSTSAPSSAITRSRSFSSTPTPRPPGGRSSG